MKQLGTSLGLAFVLLSALSCTLDSRFERELELRSGTGPFKYELLLRGHYTGRGNPHDPFDWAEKKYVQLFWIYTGVLSGRVSPEDFVVTHDRGCVAEPERYFKHLRGYIELQQETITIALEVAQYDPKNGAVTGYKSFEGNGVYKMPAMSVADFKP